MTRKRTARAPAPPVLVKRRPATTSFDLTTNAGTEAFVAHWNAARFPTARELVMGSLALCRTEFEATKRASNEHGTHEPAARGLEAVEVLEALAPRLDDEALRAVHEAMHAIESLWLVRGNALFSESVAHARRTVAHARSVASKGGQAKAGSGPKIRAVRAALRAYRGPALARTSHVAKTVGCDPTLVRREWKKMQAGQ